MRKVRSSGSFGVMWVASVRAAFMKVSPVLRTPRDLRHEAILVHIGQHSAPQMSRRFFDVGLELTDFGGLQEESTVRGVPRVIFREQTERPATITVPATEKHG